MGAVIRRERRRRGWNQEDLARQVGVNRSTLSRYEKGHQVPDRAAIDGVLAAFGWDLRELARRLAAGEEGGEEAPEDQGPEAAPSADPSAGTIAEPPPAAPAPAPTLPLQAALIQGMSFPQLHALLGGLAENAVREALARERGGPPLSGGSDRLGDRRDDG